MREGKEQTNVFIHLSNVTLNYWAHLGVSDSTTAVWLGAQGAELHQPQEGTDTTSSGSCKGFWSLDPLLPLLWGWWWKRDRGCWGICFVFLHPWQHFHAWCLLWNSTRKILLRAAGNSVLLPFWTVHCSLLEVNYSQRHFWIMPLDP